MWFFYKEIQAVHFFCLIAFFYMLQAKETRKAFTLLFTYVLLQAAAFAAYRTALLYIILHTAARAVPLMMFSSVIAGCNPSRVLASYAEIRIPKAWQKICVRGLPAARYFNTHDVLVDLAIEPSKLAWKSFIPAKNTSPQR